MSWDWRSRFSFSIPDPFRSVTLVVVAIGIGLVGWSGEPILLPAAMALPLLWASAPSRLVAGLVAAGYFLAASRGLPQGVSNFYGGGLTNGLALWVAASALFVVTHVLLWTARPGWGRAGRYAIAAIVLSLPPIGILGWAHPITAAGIVFPGWSWLGLAATAMGLLAMTTHRWPIAVLMLGGFWVASATSWTPVAPPQGWVGIDTHFGGSNGEYAGYQQHLETIDQVRAAASSGASVVVLPESALGLWTPTIERLWTRALADLKVTVYGGVVRVDEAGYDNVMLGLSGHGASVRYRQRMPVPVSMWQPWLAFIGVSAGARADFFANPIVEVKGMRVATLVCYEQLLVWPMLHSAMGSPDILVAPSNGWWTSGTNIVAIQIMSSTAWARLFDVPLVIAINT